MLQVILLTEDTKSGFEFKAKHRIAHKPHSKPKTKDIFEADFANDLKEKAAKGKGKNSSGSGHSVQELPAIRTPADIYTAFVDAVNGDYVPPKSILKRCSRENSVCSDTSESSPADFDDRRGILSISCEEVTCSDTKFKKTQEDSPEPEAPVV
ncbi:hypothetical protein MC885_002896, partial [Smutsia gigantea]